jgi:hypothetical protein
MGGTVVVCLDLKMKGSKADVERIYITPDCKPYKLFVTGDATVCPDGHEPVGNGVAFVKRPKGSKRDAYTATPSQQVAERPGVIRLSWDEYADEKGAVLIIFLFPDGYVLHSADQAEPSPLVCKIFKKRMAIFWLLGNTHRASVSCSMEPLKAGDDISQLNKELNSEFFRRRPGAHGECSIQISPAVRSSNRWISGSFFLSAAIIFFALFAAAAKMLSVLVLALIIVGCLLFTIIVGVLVLAGEGRLQGKDLVEIVRLTLQQVPVLGNVARSEKQDTGDYTHGHK